MRNFYFVFCLLCFAFCLSAYSQTYSELCERAVEAIEQDSLTLAEKYIEQALKVDPAAPRNALLLSNLGTIQRRLHRYGDALTSYTLALNLAPEAIPILLNRAAIYLELNKKELARIDYSLVLDRDRANEEALQMRAYIYMKQRNYNFARADYQTLLNLNAQSFNAILGLATLEQIEGRYEAALSLLDGVLNRDVDPLVRTQRATALSVKAGVEKDMQYPELALTDLNESIQLDASQIESYLMRGQIYLLLKKKKLAKLDFEKAMMLGAEQAEVREWLKKCE